MPFRYESHPRTVAYLTRGPRPAHHDRGHTMDLNDRIGLAITKGVGTMWCAYAFALIALLSLPTVLKQAGLGIGFDFGNGTVALVAWIAQTFLQLVLLSIIIVGQDLQGRASDQRAQDTYNDAEAVLHEATQIQAHLLEQDQRITDIVARLAAIPGAG